MVQIEGEDHLPEPIAANILHVQRVALSQRNAHPNRQLAVAVMRVPAGLPANADVLPEADNVEPSQLDPILPPIRIKQVLGIVGFNSHNKKFQVHPDPHLWTH